MNPILVLMLPLITLLAIWLLFRGEVRSIRNFFGQSTSNKKNSGVFGKIGHGIVLFFCFMIVTCVALFLSEDIARGGAGMNGFVAFFIWVICMVILFKVSPMIAVLIPFVVYLVATGMSESSSDAWIGTCFFLIAAVVIVLYIKHRNKIDNSVDEGRKSGHIVCPKCGNYQCVIFIPPHVEVNDENDYYYDPYTGERMYYKKGKNVNVSGHYKCWDCGNEFLPKSKLW